MKIVGYTVGTPLPKPNFDQTDPRKGDFIKGDRSFLNIDSSLSLTGSPAEAKATGEAINNLQVKIDETSEQFKNALLDKSDIKHSHDDLYYDEAEVDALLSQKSQVQIVTWEVDD